MTKNNQQSVVRFHDLSCRGVKVYQRVTGNEGPSPLMTRYLKSQRKKPVKPVKVQPREA